MPKPGEKVHELDVELVLTTHWREDDLQPG
jgi:hypothetical protein